MLLSENALLDAVNSDEKSWGRSISRPLDDEIGYQNLDAYFAREAEKQELADLARIDDDKLLGRLVDAGFTPKTLDSLQLAPIAFVAWASDSVTEAESQAAVAAIFSDLYDRPAAVVCVQTWLDVRPPQELWDLWVDFTESRLSRSPQISRQTMGRQILRQSTQVALASGGIWGLGSVCAAENVVLQGIRNVFYKRRAFFKRR